MEATASAASNPSPILGAITDKPLARQIPGERSVCYAVIGFRSGHPEISRRNATWMSCCARSARTTRFADGHADAVPVGQRTSSLT